MNGEDGDAGVIPRILSQFSIDVCVPDEHLAENIKSACSRGLPQVKKFKPHDREMSIAGGGPSLADTLKDLRGVTVAINGSLGFLLDKGVVPWACGVLDPRPHLADIVEARPEVIYFLASTVHPSVFDKLAGCRVVLWHPGGPDHLRAIATNAREFIPGGPTMGLRWVMLGYYMGFREFLIHGLDSSFRGQRTHAYPDGRDGRETLKLHGFETSMNFIEQVDWWFRTKAAFAAVAEKDRPSLTLFGDGLLQFCDKNPVRSVAA